MRILKILEESLRIEKLHFTLLDPGKQEPQKAAKMAQAAAEALTDAIMIGGSDAVKQEKLDETIKQVKEATKGLPVILFPSSSRYISSLADAIFFMSLLNSRKLDYVIGEQVEAGLYIKKLGLEMISMGYVVVEPGMRVGKKGKVKLIKRNDVESAMKYAVAAEGLGMKFFYLEAGSGAPQPVTNKMIRGVKKVLDIPLIVGGGIGTASLAKEKAEAGADIVVTGTTVEKEDDPEKAKRKLKKIISAIN